MSVVDYKGFRVVVYARMPLDGKITLVDYASRASPQYREALAYTNSMARQLNLKNIHTSLSTPLSDDSKHGSSIEV